MPQCLSETLLAILPGSVLWVFAALARSLFWWQHLSGLSCPWAFSTNSQTLVSRASSGKSWSHHLSTLHPFIKPPLPRGSAWGTGHSLWLDDWFPVSRVARRSKTWKISENLILRRSGGPNKKDHISLQAQHANSSLEQEADPGGGGTRGEGEHTREFSGAGRERRADRTSSKPEDLSAHARSISPPGHIVTFRKIPARSTSTFHSRVCSFSSSGKTEPSLSHFLKEEWEERAFHRQNRWSKLFRPTPGCFAPKTCLSLFYAVVCTTTPPIFSSS